MKTYIIVATHGKFASGILDSAKLILGEIDEIEGLCCYENIDIAYSKVIESKVKKFDYSNKQLLVITDLLGGSVNNEFLKYMNDYKFILVSGLSLPLLLEILINRDRIGIDLIESIISDVGKYVKCCNTLILENYDDSDEL